MSNITINKNQTVNNGQFTFDSYTPITCYIVFYFIVRLDKPYPISGTKTFHKILRGTSAKKVKKHCTRACCIFSPIKSKLMGVSSSDVCSKIKGSWVYQL